MLYHSQTQVRLQTEEDVVMRARKVEVSGYRKIGRPKLRWRDVIQKMTQMRQEYIDDKHKNVERGELKFGVPTPYREKADE